MSTCRIHEGGPEEADDGEEPDGEDDRQDDELGQEGGGVPPPAGGLGAHRRAVGRIVGQLHLARGSERSF